MTQRTKSIIKRVYQCSQSWFYESTIARGEERFQVKIRRNAYDEQSYARVSIYSAQTKEWNQLASLPISQCECRAISYVDRNVGESAFVADEKELLRVAVAIACKEVRS